ncbi:MAG TPA: hypothetical protein IGS40_19250 [Trichormus sp. M33_DOE_039]|nr:hypothetical protein [Trichormus sp. M33_DOE_039]
MVLGIRPLAVQDYHRMAEAGIFHNYSEGNVTPSKLGKFWCVGFARRRHRS